MLKSVVRSQDFILSLDVESVFFHVPINVKHRKFFSSHLALPLFVNNKFMELHPGGYFFCTTPDLTLLVPSTQTPLHLCHLYHQVEECSHVTLPLGWTTSSRKQHVQDKSSRTRFSPWASSVRHSRDPSILPPPQTLPDHLGFTISSIGKGTLRVPERRCFAQWGKHTR